VSKEFTVSSNSALSPRRRPHRRSHRAVAVLATAVLGAAVALTGMPAQAVGSVGTAPSPACDAPVPGSAACLAQFRPIAVAERLGLPATNSAGLAAAALAARRGTPSATPAVAPPKQGYGPAEIKSIYTLDTSRGAGRTVAIVDAYDNPDVERDLAAFRSAYGLAPCTTANGCFRKVNQRGGSSAPEADAGWGVEIALDVQAASAACPKCKLLLVEADSASFGDLGKAVNRAVTIGAKIVSNSYDGMEGNGVVALGQKYYSHPGVAMVVSSGDAGFADAEFPSSWNKSISIGGTRAVKTKSGAWKETAWQGAGSGCSAWVAKPSWQKDRHCLKRTASDLSAVADPDTGFAVYDTYGLDQFGIKPGWLVVGGTSLSAPLIAGMIGLAGNASSLDSARYIYDHRGGLHDVVGGNNVWMTDCGGDYLCNALPGYDGPTGLGSPRGVSAL